MSSPEVRNTENRPQQKISLTERIKRIPLFWKYLFMMGSVLLLSIAVLVLINHQYLKTLTNELMDDIQTNFQYDCDHFDERIYAPITLPSVIQQSRYYSYMTGRDNATMSAQLRRWTELTSNVYVWFYGMAH